VHIVEKIGTEDRCVAHRFRTAPAKSGLKSCHTRAIWTPFSFRALRRGDPVPKVETLG
jgi:hypothetical protein